MARPKKDTAQGGNVVIENTRPCAVFLPGSKGETKAHRRRMLTPGENDVPAPHWKECKGNKAVGQYLALSWLIDRGEGKAKPLPTGLDGMGDAEAAAKLEAISDVGLLQDLRDRTASGALRDLAQARLKEVISEAHEGGDGAED